MILVTFPNAVIKYPQKGFLLTTHDTFNHRGEGLVAAGSHTAVTARKQRMNTGAQFLFHFSMAKDPIPGTCATLTERVPLKLNQPNLYRPSQVCPGLSPT